MDPIVSNPFDDYATSHKIYNLLAEEPELILLLKNQYVTDDMWYFCIQKDTSLFKEMTKPSPKMCLFALTEDGRNLKYMTTKFTDIPLTPKMIWAAITSQPVAICYVPRKLRTEDLKEYAYTLAPDMMEGVEYIRPEFLHKFIMAHPEYIKFVKNPSEDLVCMALNQDPNIAVYIKDFTHRIIALIKDKYPDLIILLPLLHEDIVVDQKTTEV